MEDEKEFNTANIKNFTDAFAFLMANRHKQNEAIKELAEQERKNQLVDSIEDNKSIIEKVLPKSDRSKLNRQVDPEVNAFQWLMLNRSPSIDNETPSENYKECNGGGKTLEIKPRKKSNFEKNTKKIDSYENISSKENLSIFNPIIGENALPNSKRNKKDTGTPDVNTFHWQMSNRSQSIESDIGLLGGNPKKCKKKTYKIKETPAPKMGQSIFEITTNNKPNGYLSSVNLNGSSNQTPASLPLSNGVKSNNTEKFKQVSITSPNGLRLNLINENEEINIEETFKEEILECGLKKSKSFRKAASSKKKKQKEVDIFKDSKIGSISKENSNKKMIANEPSSLSILPANKLGLDKNVEKSQPQTGIAKFFLTFSNTKIKNKKTIDLSIAEIELDDHSVISKNKKIIDLSSGEIELDSCSIITDNIVSFKTVKNKSGKLKKSELRKVKLLNVTADNSDSDFKNESSQKKKKKSRPHKIEYRSSPIKLKKSLSRQRKSKNIEPILCSTKNGSNYKSNNSNHTNNDMKENLQHIELPVKENLQNNCTVDTKVSLDSLSLQSVKKPSKLRSVRINKNDPKITTKEVKSPFQKLCSADLSPAVSSKKKDLLKKSFLLEDASGVDILDNKSLCPLNGNKDYERGLNKSTNFSDESAHQSGSNEIDISNEDECKVDESYALRRSSRKIKKPLIFTYDSFSEESKSPIFKRRTANASLRNDNILSAPLKLAQMNKNTASIRSEVVNVNLSDDEECYNIFKKTSTINKLSMKEEKKNKKLLKNLSKSSSDDDCVEITVDKSLIRKNSYDAGLGENKNKPCKAFAPIFKIKVPPTNEEIERKKARDNFLFSESPLPEVIKQISCEEENNWVPFPSHSHGMQRNEDSLWNLPDPELGNVRKFDFNVECAEEDIKWEKISCFSPAITKCSIKPAPPISPSMLCHILTHLSTMNPSFQLVTYFKDLIKIKQDSLDFYSKEIGKTSQNDNVSTANKIEEEPFSKRETKRKKRLKSTLSRSKRRKLSQGEKIEAVVEESELDIPIWQQWNPFAWNQVFSPKLDSFIGDDCTLSSMSEWFSYWKEKSEKLNSHKETRKSNSSKSDDSDTNDGEDAYSNTMLILGPPGVGKTAAVYTLSQQFGFKVLEINASSQRQGKQVMSQLLEATQSHTVSSNTSLFAPHTDTINPNTNSKNRNQGSANCSNEKNVTENSSVNENSKAKALILIEDIDIIFEELDEGFMSAINTLMSTTKRPIVLTLEHNSPATLSKLKEKFEVTLFTYPSSTKIARYLQLMCLADGVFANYDDLKTLIEINSNDIRKSILDLQFWQISGTSNVKYLPKEIDIINEKYKNDPLFSNVTLNSLEEIPESNDCLWSKPDIRLVLEREACLDWKLISHNMSYLFSFPLCSKSEKKHKYPLNSDDPFIQNAQLWQKINSELFEFDTPPKKKNQVTDPPKPEKKALLSSQGSAIVVNCLNNLLLLQRTLCDLDILENCLSKTSVNNSSENLNSYYANLYPGLDILESDNEHSSSLYSSHTQHGRDLIQGISNGIFQHTKFSLEKQFSNLFDARELLTVEGDNSIAVGKTRNNLMKSNMIPNVEIRDKLESYCSLGALVNRTGLHLEYFSYIREIARSDQLSEILHKLKKQRRFLPQMKQLGFYFSPLELNDLCNVFTSL